MVMLTSLARFFRISLSRGSNVIPIADELEHARHYLTIQKMRYKNKFSAAVTAEDGVESLYTIKLIVQPVLENAIYHGMAYADGDGEITVRAFRDGGDVCIEVTDNGPGHAGRRWCAGCWRATAPTPAPRARASAFATCTSGCGLTFGEPYGLTILSEPDDGTTVRIRLPALDEEAARPLSEGGEAVKRQGHAAAGGARCWGCACCFCCWPWSRSKAARARSWWRYPWCCARRTRLCGPLPGRGMEQAAADLGAELRILTPETADSADDQGGPFCSGR